MCFKLRVWSSPPARAAAPWAVTLFFRHSFSRQQETRHRRPAWPRLGPACRSPVDIRVARARNAARGGGSGERDTGRRLGSGSDLLRTDSEAGCEDPETGKLGLGGQPVSPLGRATQPCLQAPPDGAGQVSGQHCRSPDRIAAHFEAEPGPGQRRPSAELDVSSWQACGSRPPPP